MKVVPSPNRAIPLERGSRLSVIKWRGCFLVLMLTMWSITAPADEVFFDSTIVAIYPERDGQVAIVLANDDQSSCPSTQNPKYFNIQVGQSGVTPEALANMYAAAIVAFTGGYAVSVNFDNGTNDCFVNRIYVHADGY